MKLAGNLIRTGFAKRFLTLLLQAPAENRAKRDSSFLYFVRSEDGWLIHKNNSSLLIFCLLLFPPYEHGCFFLRFICFSGNLSLSFCKPFQVLKDISDLQHRHNRTHRLHCMLPIFPDFRLDEHTSWKQVCSADLHDSHSEALEWIFWTIASKQPTPTNIPHTTFVCSSTPSQGTWKEQEHNPSTLLTEISAESIRQSHWQSVPRWRDFHGESSEVVECKRRDYDLFKLQDVFKINAGYEVISSCTHSSTCIPW